VLVAVIVAVVRVVVLSVVPELYPLLVSGIVAPPEKVVVVVPAEGEEYPMNATRRPPAIIVTTKTRAIFPYLRFMVPVQLFPS
jgi:hypothetical protein